MVKRLRLHKNPSCPERIYPDTEREIERECVIEKARRRKVGVEEGVVGQFGSQR